MPNGRPVSAFISWAHAHSSWPPGRARRWRQTVLDFATSLRTVGGIDADLDLWHSTSHENWSTYGVSAIRQSDFVLIVVSEAFRERWEETGDPTVGAGAAREANALKGLFDLDRADFLRRVKVVMLPGAEVDDIPLELLSSTERFRIETLDAGGLERLLRTLHGRPDFEKPPLGAVPPLPPTFLAAIASASPGTPDAGSSANVGRETGETQGSPISTLESRRDAIESRLADDSALTRYELDGLRSEKAVIESTLAALRTAAEAAARNISTAPGRSEPDEVAEAADHARTVIDEARAATSVLPPVVREALFQYMRSKAPLTVGGERDRFPIADAIRNEEDGYVTWVEDEPQMVTPRTAHPQVEAAFAALQEVRSAVFGGDSLVSRARAAPWAQLLLRDEFDVEDPEFELRPVWVQLGFLSK